jgi:alanine racemase
MIRVVAQSGPAFGEFQRPTLLTLAGAVASNVAVFRARTRARIMAVVKADGYGHGAVTVARAAVAAGAQWLGVTDLAEAYALRVAGIKVPILAWLNPAGLDAETAATARVDVAVSSSAELAALCRPGSAGIRVHLNLDTGMAREGCPAAEWDALIAHAHRCQQRGQIRVVGLMGQLPQADQGQPAANQEAVKRMTAAREILLSAGFGAPIVHLAATAGVLHDPATHFDLVRVGAGLVGIDPAGITALHAASRLTAPVVHNARVDPGTPVGYGGTYVTDIRTNLCVLPLGYADGIPREISPEAAVEISGRRYPVVGRVSMDQLVVATGDECFPRGTTATIFGPSGEAAPTIQDWARWAGTIPHTIVTGIGPRVRRTAG